MTNQHISCRKLQIHITVLHPFVLPANWPNKSSVIPPPLLHKNWLLPPMQSATLMMYSLEAGLVLTSISRHFLADYRILQAEKDFPQNLMVAPFC